MIRNLAKLLFVGLSAMSAFAYYVQYFIWRDCFNELGRCYDPDTGTVYLEQSGLIWGILTAVFLAAILVLKFEKPRT